LFFIFFPYKISLSITSVSLSGGSFAIQISEVSPLSSAAIAVEIPPTFSESNEDFLISIPENPTRSNPAQILPSIAAASTGRAAHFCRFPINRNQDISR